MKKLIVLTVLGLALTVGNSYAEVNNEPSDAEKFPVGAPCDPKDLDNDKFLDQCDITQKDGSVSSVSISRAGPCTAIECILCHPGCTDQTPDPDL